MYKYMNANFRLRFIVCPGKLWIRPKKTHKAFANRPNQNFKVVRLHRKRCRKLLYGKNI